MTAEQCLAVFTQCATDYPAARFLVIAIAPDGSDAVELGWGLALPDYVITDLPEVGLSGRFRSTGSIVQILGHTMDTRVIWVDPQPAH